MMYKAKVAVCSDIRTKHSKQSEHHVEIFECSNWWHVKKPLGVKRLIIVWKIKKMTVAANDKVDVN